MNLKYRRLYQRYQGFVVPLSMIGMSFIIFFLVVIPAIKQAIGVFQQVRDREEEVSGLKKKFLVLEQLDVEMLKNNLTVATSAIPLDKSLPSILRTIESISGQTQVTITNVSLSAPGAIATDSARSMGPSEREYGMFFIPFTVSLTGTLDQLRSFLQTSTTVRRFVRAKSFTLTITGNQLNTQVAFDAFYAPLPPTRADTELQTLLPNEEKTLSRLTTYPNAGDIPLVQDVGQSVSQTGKVNPFAP